jgi:hypothetical protein
MCAPSTANVPALVPVRKRWLTAVPSRLARPIEWSSSLSQYTWAPSTATAVGVEAPAMKFWLMPVPSLLARPIVVPGRPKTGPTVFVQ